jgi:predicted N-acetyltransferase YhbS
MEKQMNIRLETPADYAAVEQITREAFWNHHVPGCDEHYLAHVLRKAECFLPELDFVAELDGTLVGNIMYTNAKIVGDDGTEYPVLSFGPISVLPEFQRRGVGGKLILHTLSLAKEMGHTAVLIYGDPDYYSRFGFVSAEQYGIGTRYNTYAAALQAVELVPGALAGKAGLFYEDEAYEIDPAEAEAFDRLFPPKEKQTGLASQAKFLQHLSMQKPRE